MILFVKEQTLQGFGSASVSAAGSRGTRWPGWLGSKKKKSQLKVDIWLGG